jgi:predicted transglutaminase-like cysteine proteinase
VFALFFTFVCTSIMAAPSPIIKTAPLRISGPTHPTAAGVEFCQKDPASCAVDPSQPTTIHLTDAKLATLRTINTQVNHAIKPVSDLDHWGVVDRWDFAEDGRGDCEDYQLVKRRELEKLGFPRRAMRMAVVLDENKEGHAVLVVRTDLGDLVLDNKSEVIVPWSSTGYEFIKGEGDTTGAWVTYAQPDAVLTASH